LKNRQNQLNEVPQELRNTSQSLACEQDIVLSLGRNAGLFMNEYLVLNRLG